MKTIIIDWQAIIVGVSYLGAFFGFLAGLLKFLKSQGILPTTTEDMVGAQASNFIEDIAGSPIAELTFGTLGMLRNWIVSTNPTLIQNAANRVIQLIPNHAKNDNKVFKFVVENDEELLTLVLDFYNTVRDIASSYDEV